MLRFFRASLYLVEQMQMLEPERKRYPSVLPSPLSQMRTEMGPQPGGLQLHQQIQNIEILVAKYLEFQIN